MSALPIDVVLPVHNEAESISATLREFHENVAGEAGIPIRFVICEDGSTDDTVAVLQAQAKALDGSPRDVLSVDRPLVPSPGSRSRGNVTDA